MNVAEKNLKKILNDKIKQLAIANNVSEVELLASMVSTFELTDITLFCKIITLKWKNACITRSEMNRIELLDSVIQTIIKRMREY